MSDTVLTISFVGIFVAIAILLFMAFRRSRGSCLGQLVLAFFALSAVWTLFLVLAGLAEKPLAFTDQSRLAFPAAFVILAFLIVVVKRGVPIPTPITATRKRPLIVDMIGCAVLGVVGLIVFIAGIAMLIVLAR
jgi:hypothetical protein